MAPEYGIDKDLEDDYSNWMESITFVDKNFNPLPEKLEKDGSDDPEEDRQ